MSSSKAGTSVRPQSRDDLHALRACNDSGMLRESDTGLSDGCRDVEVRHVLLSLLGLFFGYYPQQIVPTMYISRDLLQRS